LHKLKRGIAEMSQRSKLLSEPVSQNTNLFDLPVWEEITNTLEYAPYCGPNEYKQVTQNLDRAVQTLNQLETQFKNPIEKAHIYSKTILAVDRIGLRQFFNSDLSHKANQEATFKKMVELYRSIYDLLKPIEELDPKTCKIFLKTTLELSLVEPELKQYELLQKASKLLKTIASSPESKLNGATDFHESVKRFNKQCATTSDLLNDKAQELQDGLVDSNNNVKLAEIAHLLQCGLELLNFIQPQSREILIKKVTLRNILILFVDGDNATTMYFDNKKEIEQIEIESKNKDQNEVEILAHGQMLLGDAILSYSNSGSLNEGIKYARENYLGNLRKKNYPLIEDIKASEVKSIQTDLKRLSPEIIWDNLRQIGFNIPINIQTVIAEELTDACFEHMRGIFSKSSQQEKELILNLHFLHHLKNKKSDLKFSLAKEFAHHIATSYESLIADNKLKLKSASESREFSVQQLTELLDQAWVFSSTKGNYASLLGFQANQKNDHPAAPSQSKVKDAADEKSTCEKMLSNVIPPKDNIDELKNLITLCQDIKALLKRYQTEKDKLDETHIQVEISQLPQYELRANAEDKYFDESRRLQSQYDTLQKEIDPARLKAKIDAYELTRTITSVVISDLANLVAIKSSLENMLTKIKTETPLTPLEKLRKDAQALFTTLRQPEALKFAVVLNLSRTNQGFVSQLDKVTIPDEEKNNIHKINRAKEEAEAAQKIYQAKLDDLKRQYESFKAQHVKLNNLPRTEVENFIKLMRDYQNDFAKIDLSGEIKNLEKSERMLKGFIKKYCTPLVQNVESNATSSPKVLRALNIDFPEASATKPAAPLAPPEEALFPAQPSLQPQSKQSDVKQDATKAQPSHHDTDQKNNNDNHKKSNRDESEFIFRMPTLGISLTLFDSKNTQLDTKTSKRKQKKQLKKPEVFSLFSHDEPFPVALIGTATNVDKKNKRSLS